jgi:hypothetical protein
MGVFDSGVLAQSSALTFLAAFFTVILSVPLGAALAFYAGPRLKYALALVLLLVPFALGSSVWAYSVTRLCAWSGLQQKLVISGTFQRFVSVLALSLARTVPLGIFFCSTTLHRYTVQLRPYFRIHRLELPFFLVCAFNRMPKSILMLLGLFGGALMASEASLPTFLYRANPGTQPETTNIMLSRVFREMYGSLGPESLSNVAFQGLFVALVLVLSALVGALLGRLALHLIKLWLECQKPFVGAAAKSLGAVVRISIALCFLPGLSGLLGLVIPFSAETFKDENISEKALAYTSIVEVGVFVGAFIMILSVAIAIRLRYGQRDILAWIVARPAMSCLLLLPAFLPVLSIVAILAKLSHGHTSGIPGFSALIISHIGLHYSVFQFICMTIIVAIPEYHVAWQRAMRISYLFSVVTDGIKRHSAVLIALIGLCTVQVVTDGSISRWFTQLVTAPEEALYASVFGRLASSAEATLIAWSVGFVAILVCGVLATAYIRELKNHARYG